MNYAGGAWQIGRPISPIPGESLDGYVARVAADNWIENVLDLTRQAGVTYAQSPILTTHCWEGLPALADCLGVNVEELQARSYPRAELQGHRLFFGVPVNRGEIESYNRLFAPKSLSISGHHRALWQLRSFPFCHETWQYLIDRCPRCDELQRWCHTNGVDRCDHCIEDLSIAATLGVPLEQRDALLGAIGLIHPDPDLKARSLAKLPEPLRELDAGSAYELLFCTASMLAPRMDRVRSKHSGSRPDDTVITKAVAEAWTMLTEWPRGPYAYFIERVITATASHNDGNAGRTVRFLRLPQFGHTTRPVAKVIDELRASIDLTGPRRAQLLESTCSVQEAAIILGTKSQPLVPVRRNGGLNTVFLINRGRATVRFDLDEVSRIGAALKDRYAPERVAWKYGLPIYALEQLMAMNIIATVADRFCVQRFGLRQPTREAVSHFEEQIMATATATSFDQPITLRMASRGIGGRLKPWGPIFDAMLNGAIPFSVTGGSRRLVHRIVLDRSALVLFDGMSFDTARYPETTRRRIITRLEAGEILNLEAKAYTPVANQLPGYGGDLKDVLLDDVIDVARKHIGSTEMGVRLNVPARNSYKLARKAGVPVLGPAGWCRSEAEAKLLLS